MIPALIVVRSDSIIVVITAIVIIATALFIPCGSTFVVVVMLVPMLAPGERPSYKDC